MTDNNKQPRSIRENLEKVLIAVIFIAIGAFYIITGNKELKNSGIYTAVLILEILLALYYGILIKNLYSLFLIGFIALNTGQLLPYSYHSLAEYLILAGKITLAILGIYLGYKTIRESLKNKDWELFGTLITIALLFPLFHHFYFPSNQDYLMVYHFSLAFMLGTVMYNENLWDKYNFPEKKLLTYILVSTVAEVLFISIKLI